MTSQKAQWQLLHPQSPKDNLELQKWLLADRAITDEDQFLLPPHPLEITSKSLGITGKELKKTVTRIMSAIANDERVVIAGDYDADGICATAVLWLACKAIGLIARPFIPNRHKHGYGLNQRSIPDLIGEVKPDLIITVDNGIVAHEAIESLNNLGIEVIITDHHEKTKVDPQAFATIHTTQLCGAGVAWILARELFIRNTPKSADKLASQLLDLVAIATIADQVPLLDANRSFAYHGLQVLRTTNRYGLQALFEVAAIEQITLDEWSVSFQLAPRLNALGRLSHGMDALRLLCGGSKHFAQQRARLLEEANTERQEITQDLYERAKQMVIAQKDQTIIVIAGSEFHEGIIGLLAGKLVEEYGKPAIVIATNDKLAKGSVRSVAGFHITDFLRNLSGLFLELGGHAMAAGFAIDPTRITEVINTIQTTAQKKLALKLAKNQIIITCPLEVNLLSLAIVESLVKFAPFGQGNPRPLFLLENWKIINLKQIGATGKHLKFVLSKPDEKNFVNTKIEALWWKHGEMSTHFTMGSHISIVGRLEKQTWKNQSFVQLVVVDALSLDA